MSNIKRKVKFNDIKVHLVFSVKYRKPLLIGYGKHVKDSFSKIASRYGFLIDNMEVDKDHIHLLIVYNRNERISEIVRKLKQISTSDLWNDFEARLQNHFWKKRVFWSPGYYCSGVGSVDEEMVWRYIDSQGL